MSVMCEIDGPTAKPGEVILRKLFNEFTVLAEKKLDTILSNESLEKPLAKSLQRGEDPIFDQLLIAFGSVAEHCLPSQLRILFKWYEKQIDATAAFVDENQRIIRSTVDSQFSSKSGSLTKSNIQSLDNSDIEIYYILEKRDLGVEFIFCLVLIEILKQLHLHPGYDELTSYIENLAFKHFKFREDAQNNPNLPNINMIADLYAEVIGVLAQSRFQSVRKRFMSEFMELRAKEPSPITTHSIISLLMGMKFFRIKMVPIEEFEASFQFMHECAVYFLDVKDKDIKHALAGLFVEILVPVAATVKNEVNVPCLKNFVELLYNATLDLCTKKKHCLALFPLVTCLLCVSQKAFFLLNWHYFLAMCLSHLKNRDSKMSRVALESLYRLLWVYMIRIKCESNTATQSRLHSIVNSLFPKGSKAVVPRDTPLNIFVKIIQFIAQERLDFAMKEIVFDLLSVGRSIKIILTPERMSIGLRSFLVVADSLQQKDGEPPMPRTLGVLPSGNTLRVKKTFLNKMLTDEMAKNIGMNHYYPYVRKTLSDILRALDVQFGRPLMMTNLQNLNKEPDDMITGERKPKIDLFRTCVAAIPRLIPDGISKNDLIDLLSRLTAHMDEEMNVLAFQSLQNLVVDFADWREDVIEGFIHFILYEINDAFPSLIENALKMLFQLLTSWKNAIQQQQPQTQNHFQYNVPKPPNANKMDQTANVLYNVDALALVMLCYCRQPMRRLAGYILKESKAISNLILPANKNYDEPVASVIDAACPLMIENCFPYITANERSAIISMSYQVDLQWLTERTGNSWVFDRGMENACSLSDSANDVNHTPALLSYTPDSIIETQNFDDELKLNAWNVCFMSLMTEVVKNCPSSVAYSWPIICKRLNTLFTQIDPNPVNDNRAASILRTTSNIKRAISSFDRSFYLELWKNYLMYACSVAPSSIVVHETASRCTSIQENCVSPDSMADKCNSIDGNRSPIMNRVKSVQSLLKQTIPLLRCEQYDLRNAVVLGLSQVNQYALADLLEELVPYFREANDRKQENVRRRKRRELLRLQIGRLFKFISERKIFALCPVVLDRDNSFSNILVEYIDGVRLYFESENDKETNSYILDTKESYCHLLCNLFKCFTIDNRRNKLSRELRQNLFNLFAGWSGKYGNMFLNQRQVFNEQQMIDFSKMTELEYLSIKSMSTVLCAGSIFDSKNLLDGNSLYFWLKNLLNAKDKRLNDVGLETLILLLENNLDAGALLEWLIECCYTQNTKIADSCFIALATIFSIREYPCDRYIAIIIVTIVNVACARIEIQQLALQLLQILDNRFFCSSTTFKDYSQKLLHDSHNNSSNRVVDCSPNNTGHTVGHSSLIVDDERHCHFIKENGAGCQSFKEFEPLLLNLYPCSQTNISKRMAYLHPQLTMIVFSEITYRFQSAKPTVCQNLLNFLIPWLHNMQLVDPTVPLNCDGDDRHDAAFSFSRSSMAADDEQSYYQREGWGSIESTQMVLNNLFFITIKFGDDYPNELENVWASLCSNRPNNLKIIIRYLFVLTGLASNELLPCAKKIAIYLARAQPERVIDELMTELQAVEFLSFNAERTEAFPYFRIINRKCSATHLDDDNGNNVHAVIQNRKSDGKETHTEVGMLHTKRHSKDLHAKYDLTSVDNISGKIADQYRNYDSFNGSASSDEYNILTELSNNEDSLPLSDRYVKPSTPQPRPLPMPEYGGYYAPLNDFLSCNPNSATNSNTNQNIGFHRCNLALMLLSDIVTQDISVDWSPHIPLMLHILFLGMDHSKSIVYEHCKQLLLNLLIVACKHNDNLNVARILLINRIQQQGYGLPVQLSFPYNFNSTNLNDSNTTAQKSSELDLNQIFTKSSENIVTATTAPANSATTEPVNINDIHLNIEKDDLDISGDSGGSGSVLNADKDSLSDTTEKNNESVETTKKSPEQQDPMRSQKFSLDLYIKTLIDFVSSKRGSPLWNYEDITAKVWSIRSAEQMSCFVEHVLFVFKESLSFAKIENRWADIALQLALSCSSRHYAGRSLQIFRALKIPINTRMLSDILSRLVETVSEQGEDMQGYVTELMLTLESAIDSFDFKPRNILDLINEYFHFENIEMDETYGIGGDDIDDDEANVTDQDLLQDAKDHEDNFSNTINLDDNLLPVVNNVQSNSSSTTLVTPSIPTSQSHVENFNKRLKMPNRNTSYSMSFPTRRFNFLDDQTRDSYPRFRTTTDVDSFYSLKNQRSKCNSLNSVAMGRSQSVQSLKNACNDSVNGAYTLDDKTSILAQFFWISVVILETDYEHEFLLAIRVLDKVLQKLSLEDIESQEKIEKLFIHFKWHHFPGVHALLMKGLQSPVNYEPTINLLHKLTPYLKISVIDPSKSEVSFPFHIMGMLPYLLHNYDDPNMLCIQAAVSFAQWCNEASNNLENLATVMTLYSKRCFSKENSQWTKCVVKYLYDAYPGSFVNIFSFLVEVAEKGPQIFLNHILSILHFMLNYIDLSTTRLIHEDILSVSTKYMEGPQWKDALKILKLAVARSSTLAAPSYSAASTYGCGSSIISSIVSCGYSDCVSIASSSFTDSEFSSIKRELPGRTMDFIFDLNDTPIVGYKFIQKRQMLHDSAVDSVRDSDSAVSSLNTNDYSQADSRQSEGVENDLTLRKLFEVKENLNVPTSINNAASNQFLDTSTLKRSGTSQNRIRERLISLLNRCGQRSGGLPKSPSVIFSQNSDIVEHKSSMASSVEDISATNNDVSGDSKHDDTAHGEFAFFKEFDFLEYELESQEGESLDNFNWGVRRKSLSNLDTDMDSNKTVKVMHSDTLKPHMSMSYLISNKLKQTNNDDFSSDEEVESVSPLYEMNTELTPQDTPLQSFNENPLAQSRPASLISHGSSHSLGSDADFTITNTSPNVNPTVSVTEAEEQWSTQFIQLINDTTGFVCAMGNHILSLIFKNTFTRITDLTKESCNILSQANVCEQYSSISGRFNELLYIVSVKIDFPFVFLDPKLFALVPNLLERHRFGIMELHAHWETFAERKECLSDCIQSLKNAEKIVDHSMEKLCKHLYRMYFQLFLLFECYLKYVDILNIPVASFEQLNNRSVEIAILKKELQKCLDDPQWMEDSFTFATVINGQMSKENENELKDLIQSGQLLKALRFVRALKDNISDLTGDDLIQTLLTIYCRIQLCSQNYFLAITEPECNLREITRQLMDTSFKMYNSFN